MVAFLDDLRDWPFTVKLGAQVLAALAAVGSGLYVRDYRMPYVGRSHLGWVGIAATVVWILFATNAMNFIDGLNGLAAGIALIAARLPCGHRRPPGRLVRLFRGPAAGRRAGRLPALQLPPRAHLHGRCRQPVLRLRAGRARRRRGALRRVEMSFLLVPMLLSGVLFDVAFTLVRRALAGERLTAAHRGHLYQVAQRAGIPAPVVAMVHWGFAVFGGLCCLGVHRGPGGSQALRAMAHARPPGRLAGVGAETGPAGRHRGVVIAPMPG